jgi:hypothetical protein
MAGLILSTGTSFAVSEQDRLLYVLYEINNDLFTLPAHKRSMIDPWQIGLGSVGAACEPVTESNCDELSRT